MKKYLMFNNLVKFNLYLENDLYVSKLKDFFGDYILFHESDEKETTQEVALSIVIIDNEDYLIDLELQEQRIDGYGCDLKDDKFYIIFEKNDLNNNALFLKRILSDIVNRFIEKKGGLFFHSSSVVCQNKSIVFVGDKGTGKTTNMLYILNRMKLDYSSNERTGLIKIDNTVFTYGNPSRINIRVNTLEQNEELKKLLCDKIDMSNYENYKNLILSRDCSERVVVSFEDLCNSLSISCIPFSNLGAICNLVFDQKKEFDMEEVLYDDIKQYLRFSKIDGVFEQRKELNEIFSCNNIDIDSILKDSENIRYYNIFQNNSRDNSKEIMKRIKEDMRVEKCLKKF